MNALILMSVLNSVVKLFECLVIFHKLNGYNQLKPDRNFKIQSGWIRYFNIQANDKLDALFFLVHYNSREKNSQVSLKSRIFIAIWQ